MIQVGIIGGAGYTAGELIRLLMHHKNVALNFVYSTSNAGNYISAIHQDILLDIKFSDSVNPNVDVLFLGLGHGTSKLFLENHAFNQHTKIIDLSSDFRLNENSAFNDFSFVYGLPELNYEAIKKASYVANPGCFATAIQLAILPLAEKHSLTDSIHVNAVTGATGAGTLLSKTSHFTWRDNNFSHYKAFTHKHLDEIKQSINQLQPTFKKPLYFIPNRGNFSRGIFASIYTKFHGSLDEAKAIYSNYYNDARFTFLSHEGIHLKQVVNTNNCLIHVTKHEDVLLVTSIVDNLLKGASGQAVQNMNLMFGFDEKEGLQLKANYF